MVWWLRKHFEVFEKWLLLIEKIHLRLAWAEHPKRYSNDRNEIIFYVIVWRQRIVFATILVALFEFFG